MASGGEDSINNEELRRQQEMNLFASYAVADDVFDGSSLRIPPSTPTSAAEATAQGGHEDHEAALPTATNLLKQQEATWNDMGGNAFSGSFALTPSAVVEEENENLSAAVAALSKDEINPDNLTNENETSLSFLPSTSQKRSSNYQRFRTDHPRPNTMPDFAAIAEEDCMFAELIVFHRPLFFGAIVPPRVLQCAKDMIVAAVRAKQSEEYRAADYHPRLHELPDAVRNVVGALRTHGFGLDKQVLDEPFLNSLSLSKRTFFRQEQQHPVAPSSHSHQQIATMRNTSAASWRGDGTVSTFQPVWGSDVRAERVKEYKAKRKPKPPTVARVSTAPPRMVALSDDDDDEMESDDKNDMYFQSDVALRGLTIPVPPDHYGGTASMKHSRIGQSVDEDDDDDDDDPNEQFTAWLMRSVEDDGDDCSLAESPVVTLQQRKKSFLIASPKQLTEQEIFSKWVLGSSNSEFANDMEDSGMSAGIESGTFQNKGKKSPFDGSTFQRLSQKTEKDDDSLIDDEQNTEVGVNENLSKAIGMFSDDNSQAPDAPISDPSQVLLSQVDESRKRPLTNYELTGGYAPLFNVDDAPLPQESDLGLHETKEEQQRAFEQKRSQEVIEKFVPPNVFGPIACPNPAVNPDDFHSWNSRAIVSQREPLATSANSIASDPLSHKSRLYSLPGKPNMESAAPSRLTSVTTNSKPPRQRPRTPKVAPKQRVTTSRQRYGWWHDLPETDDDTNDQHHQSRDEKTSEASKDDETEDPSLQLPPIHHSSSTMQILTPLEPSPDKLKEDNLPLSRMHSATSMAQTLPYLSDRPHSFRYLQIDAQQIAFPPLKDEIEPLFCSLAIYNVETISSGMSTGAQHPAPVPDWQRCGRVTEALHFDHVTSSDVESAFASALWPYSSGGALAAEVPEGTMDRLRGTLCGVFPLPSNLNVSNLYAVLIVRKILSEDADFDPYLKPRKPLPELEKLKSNAEKACNRHGSFLLPFAFGVVPLLQVFGIDNPVIASSRAVQIPLFQFSDGERQIVDHIMVMLFPRADHKANGVGGPAPVTNGGTAMLVMRNFGYLGLHAVVDSKSSLARHRLVDFTGELQLRRRTKTDEMERRGRRVAPDNYRVKLPAWHPQCIAEPVVNGGRNVFSAISGDVSEHGDSDSKLYAQELATLPLMLAPSSRLSSGPQAAIARVHPTQDDIEPFFYTSFCNELICHPRILHNCWQGHISIRVELREIEWCEEIKSYLAHVPRSSIGPSIHNNRRGPFLVQSSFTSCTSRRGDHHFIDEFKIKLPLDLNPRNVDGKSMSLSVFFTAYRVKTGSKSLWKRGAKKIFGTTLLESLAGSADESDVSGRVEQVACGFLPISADSCLIDNGLHDVRVVYMAEPPPLDMIGQGITTSNSLLLVERAVNDEKSGVLGHNESLDNDTTSIDSPRESDLGILNDSVLYFTQPGEEHSRKNVAAKLCNEPLSLSVRIVAYSSLHSQNNALTTLLNQESDLPLLSYIPNKIFMTSLRMGRDFINGQVGQNPRISRTRENQMLDSTVAIADLQLCPMPRSTGHLFRIMSILWRALLCGDGDPDLVWANPAASLPLRVHAFATILHLIGTTSLYLAKNGVTQVDGTGKLSFVVIGRVLALLFDERKLFGQQAIEKFDEQYWSSVEVAGPASGSPPPKKSPPKRRGHVRQTYELGNDIEPRVPKSSVSSFTSTAGDLATSIKPDKLDTPGLPWNFEIEFETNRVGVQLPSKLDVKLDTKSDFQSFLRAAEASNDEFDICDHSAADAVSSVTTKALIQAYGGLSVGGNRRYMTVPASVLPTILEQSDDPSHVSGSGEVQHKKFRVTDTEHDVSEKELAPSASQRPTKQMRRPRVTKSGGPDTDNEKKPSPKDSQIDLAHPLGADPTSEDDVQTMGDAFLDKLSLGLSSTSLNRDGEQKHVGSSHHRRRTQGRSSIDWSLIGEESTSPTLSGSLEDSSSNEGTLYEYNERMFTLKKEETTAVKLPSFLDRLVIIGSVSSDSARWFPFAYEVIILQWAAFLLEQRKSGEKAPDRTSTSSFDGNEDLTHAAMRSVGVAVASAPMLFEVIKQSLGFRIKSLFDTMLAKKDVRITPPLLALDDTLMINLVQVVSMLADACIDTRNFDSWDLRQMSIDVNDSIVRFLRDLFSFLAPACVHKLILAYLSRFLTREGKHYTDRDSLIGLRCSWEITKLRLNAVTAFVRFPDFIKVNGPQMLNWNGWWTGAPPPRASTKFFDDIIMRYRRFQLPEFVGNDVGIQTDAVIPSMRPHWLAEIVVDICLQGTEHAEQYIQHRSASLLHEMFWSCSQESILLGISSPVASMFVTLIEKLVLHASYLSNFSPKSQLRKDLLLSCTFVLQSTAPNLLRAQWRRLCSRLPGKGSDQRYGLLEMGSSDEGDDKPTLSSEQIDEADILDMFSLLNLSLRTSEYEGSDENMEADGSGDNRESIEVWRKEYLLSKNFDSQESDQNPEDERAFFDADNTSSTSRKWQSHDAATVVVNTGHQIVMEMYSLLSKSPSGKSLLNPAVKSNLKSSRQERTKQSASNNDLPLTLVDIILFVRGATSLYLHALSLRTSDIVVAKTFVFSAEIIKIFGIKLFLHAVGETLQHWMRVISLHCGARRAQVRIEATDLLELMLRSTWECYGSFFRIRVPLLAVQTEVMERIVATAATRYYRDQRRLRTTFETFTNLGAEASLVPLWRTLDRIQKKPASQHVSFRGALIRIAGKLKKLYKAYVAARVLSFINSSRDKQQDDENFESDSRDYDDDARIRASRISILRVINASEGHSKQFLGFQGTSQLRHSVAHYEAVEDALIAAANVFSPTELPEHRVAWLRMLSEFHSSRKKYGEEATCHYYIHVTLHLAARLHGSLWSNTPFLPWTDNLPDPIVYIDSDAAPAADPDCSSESNFDEWDYNGQVDNSNSFRRIFYRVANSIAIGNNEWESGESKTFFFGITFPSEFDTVSPWITLRQMEENMVEEVETAGSLFLKAGIIESSRFSWNRATQYYAEKFNYAKLSIVYGNLSRAVVSQVPSIDTNLPQEVLTTLGRFYRVWFHGGAPDDLNGVEFVYRSFSRLKEFGEELRGVILSVLPSNTPIHLVLDGQPDEMADDSSASFSGYRIGPTPIEAVRIKVTPLRPLFDNYVRTRGVPEWFYRYVDDMFPSQRKRARGDLIQRGSNRRIDSIPSVPGEDHDPHHVHIRSHNATVFSSVGSSAAATTCRIGASQSSRDSDRMARFSAPSEGDLSGVDKFCFVQPKNRSRSIDWWKASDNDLAEKSLRVTQLQVAESFPACVARQVVAHRLVYSQSPLEAGIDVVCQWCSILFRTAVATSGMAVLKTNYDPGIGTDAAKVVADCIHNSHVKEIGLFLLQNHSETPQPDSISDFTLDSGRLDEDEISKLQLKLARLIITFVELLHLLVGRNRDMLLDVIQERKKTDITVSLHGGSVSRGVLHRGLSGVMRESSRKTGSAGPSPSESNTGIHKRNITDGSRSEGVRSEDARTKHHHHAHVGSEDNQSYHSMMTSSGVRTDSAIAVQSELQRAFISLTKALSKNVHGVMKDTTPRWFKQSGQDNYFSLGTYLQAKIPIAEELCFTTGETMQSDTGSHHPFTNVPSLHSEQGYESPRGGSIDGGSQSSVVSRGSERYGFGQF